MIKLKVIEKLGGLANYNFLAIDDKTNKKLILKLLNPFIDVLGCRTTENLLSNVVSQENCKLHTPKFVWKCTNISITDFVEGSEPIAKRNLLTNEEYLGE
jgi:hypothetical protein